MKPFLKFIINFISLISGIITIVALFVQPEAIALFLGQFFRLSMIFEVVTEYLRFLFLIPLLSGVVVGSKYGGFSFPRFLYDPLHLLSSFVMFEFWLGVGKGIKYIGYLFIPIALILSIGVFL